MPMQPNPTAETSKPLVPSVHFCIVSVLSDIPSPEPDTRRSVAVVFVVGDVLAPVRFRPLVSGGGGLGNGQVAHEVIRRGALPGHILCGSAHDVAFGGAHAI